MNKLYSFTDLSIATWIIDTANELTHRLIDIQWAYKVVYFFDRLFAYARKCIGAWSARIKLAWNWAKDQLINKLNEWMIKSYENRLDHLLDLITKYGENNWRVSLAMSKGLSHRPC